MLDLRGLFCYIFRCLVREAFWKGSPSLAYSECEFKLVSVFLPTTWFSWFMSWDFGMAFGQHRQVGHILTLGGKQRLKSQLGDAMHSKKWSARSPVAGLSCFYCSESVSFPLLAIFSCLSPPQGADEGHFWGWGEIQPFPADVWPQKGHCSHCLFEIFVPGQPA